MPNPDSSPPPKTEATLPVHTRIAAAFFVTSIPFAGETVGAQVGRNCTSIVPARLEADGSAVTIDKGQRADGLQIRSVEHDRKNNTKYIGQCFVPWANVRGITYVAAV